jgi:hypothetical protein
MSKPALSGQELPDLRSDTRVRAIGGWYSFTWARRGGGGYTQSMVGGEFQIFGLVSTPHT